MFKRLEDVEKKYEGIASNLLDPNITSDTKKYTQLMKEYSSLKELVEAYREYKNYEKQKQDNKHILETEKDEELRAIAKEEMPEIEKKITELSEKLKILLLPKDPNDEKNIILEIRAGAGGDEASLFSEQLFRAYTHYANKHNWKVELMSFSPSPVGGFKEVIASISGDKVYSRLKFESGVHRVQRVPKTETQGRIHTSTVTVAVLPEVQEVEININPNDLRVDVYRSGGNGGQSVNTTDSAVRITHIPTGIVVTCQDEKSQIKNRSKAMKILAARLRAAEEEKRTKEASEQRLSQIGTGDRSERIRTYNFPQSRVTDHRINHTVYQADAVMEGALDLLIDPLTTHYQSEALKNSQETKNN
jgi:peptide chain release factor 1